MSVTNKQFDRAFAELQVFGPRRGILVEERWRQTLPEVHPDEFPALRARCAEIESFAYDLAEKVHSGELGSCRAMLRLARKYPFLTLERVSRTWNQAMYFSLK
jgi:hypothetical protein